MASKAPPVPQGNVFEQWSAQGRPFYAHRGSLILVLDLLARIGPPAAEALPILEELTKSDDPRLAYRAALAIRRIEQP